MTHFNANQIKNVICNLKFFCQQTVKCDLISNKTLYLLWQYRAEIKKRFDLSKKNHKMMTCRVKTWKTLDGLS